MMSWVSRSLLFAVAAKADLPVHCVLQDVAGDWDFHVGPVVPKAFADTIATQPQCGHHIPNNVVGMLNISRGAEVPEASAGHFSMHLSEDIVLNPVRHLGVTSSDGSQGAWTMMFDEGFEVRMSDGRSFFAHFNFQVLPGAATKPSNGDRWDTIARYRGRREEDIELKPEGDLYECRCDQTSTGWWHRHGAGGGIESGCFWASKKSSNSSDAAPVSYVRMPKRGAAQKAGKRESLRGTSSSVSLLAKRSLENSRVYDLSDFPSDREPVVKEVLMAKSAIQRRVKPTEPTSKVVRLHASGSSFGREPLPAKWDWRSFIADLAPDGTDDLSEQFNQGNCGSCYAFSGAQVLQMRFRIELYRRHNVLYPLELSWRSATQCMPYTEGCEGGFAYLAFKQAAEVGLPLAECDMSKAPESLDESCDWGCYRNNTDIFYAKDYGQTGGFAHGASEEAIMREIHERGPVIVSFSTSAVPEFIWNNGQSMRNDTDVMTVIYNDKVPQEPSSKNPEILPWRYTTHSILAVGWGEETSAAGVREKYWLVRNSWGKDWGTGGYAKFRRGGNDAAIETSAPWVEPDMDRLPPGFLERAQAYHAKRTQQLASSPEEGSAKAHDRAEGKASGGRPAYCELRPDSPDCQ